MVNNIYPRYGEDKQPICCLCGKGITKNDDIAQVKINKKNGYVRLVRRNDEANHQAHSICMK